jgi:type VI secretion system protein ImpL
MKLPVALGTGAAVWLILSWVVPFALGLPSSKTLRLQLILTFAGLLIGAALAWYSKSRKQPPETGMTGGSQGASGQAPMENLLRETSARLASSALGRGARLTALPVIFVTGPEGSAKTTAVLQSGLEPELLAGQVNEDGSVAPTMVGNTWLAQRSVLIEVGSDIQANPKTWETLARHVQSGKLEAAFGKSERAPRAVVVCYECENLLKPGATETVAEAAKALRAQLYQLAAKLGSHLPVYVLFTKLDRVAFFLDFVRNLDRDEAAQIFGTTLPAEKMNTGAYGESETARLAHALGELANSLSYRRTELLTREENSATALSAYEFPREFRKLRTAAVKFLVELCRPSQLNQGPFLRGFYFAGVRPVLVNDEVGAEVTPSEPESGPEPVNLDATNIFWRQRPAMQAQSEPPVSRATRRKIPEWAFLPRFFRDVVLADRSGLAASASSVKANAPRRLLLACITGACLLWGIGSLVAFLKNRELVNSVRQSAAEAASDQSSAQTVSLESLTKLDNLRRQLVRLTEYEQGHPPISMRWGLYTGLDILPDTKRLYFARFKTLFFDNLMTGFLNIMRGWPASPPSQADYGYSYNTLKAYLEMTSNHDKATMQFLPPLLGERWSQEGTVDSRKLSLARRQFDFYTSELMRENPYSSQVDAQTVAKARQYLVQFAGVSRVYQAILSEANQSAKPVIFNQRFPGSAAVVVNTFEVPGAFTKPGFTFVENALKNPSKYVSGEKWVLGENGSQAVDTPNLAQQIQGLYIRDYINTWRDYLKRSTVVRYASLSDAAKKLALTSSPQSPLLALFWLASQNTDVSAAPVQQAFKPLHTLMPPSSVDQYVGPSNSNYMTSLTALQNSIEGASKMPPEQSQAAADQTTSAASAALLAAKQTALTLGLDAEAHIEAIIQKLMTDPITHVDAVKPNGASPAPLNAAGADFCSQYRPLMAKFPFDPNAKVQASIDELNAAFRPQQGTLWQFYNAKLNKMLLNQGGTYAPALGQKPELTTRFVTFFNNAARFSNLLYANGTSQEPKLTFALQPAFSAEIQSVSLTIDGQNATLTPNSGPQRFTWPGSGTGVRLVAKSGTDFIYPNYDGLWGLFEFFFDADKPFPSPEWMLKSGRSDKPVTSPVTNQPVTVHFNVDMLGGPPVFQKSFFKGLACVAEVAK